MSNAVDESPILKASDINDDMKDEIFKISTEAFNEFKVERDIAGSIKKQLDTKFGNTWHVIVGKNFGSYVTHEKGHFIYFYIGSTALLVFKTT
ncbi:hypothetical protein TPHA_0D02370 [Tetrapisispora phaffii CBS 4417]|uniref:Dynein light chain n=1 Tax=Tetrapisispora phaffii (strain ATCC 24235 / CBS 4417 / NBRC 1672 / NRRL Y-8282 / UCD 70-5) TaxID=1071381 RepID=G8BSQ3_TETPH|nr:hypothetical protein TPHA_0D02370 [Tetrapisispora phaffii CBS 4417]CCE62874.1 hypothetical protein TPHA_0D02370 [Tetrapisispora phaffii CBS 4417]